jgi:acyl-coenzyme A synthetase/AMP-(fatty) acid ligase
LEGSSVRVFQRFIIDAAHRLPESAHLLDDLPRNAMGKIQTSALRDHFK